MKTVTAVIVALVLAAAAGPADAKGRKHYHHNKHYCSTHPYSYFCRAGGHRMGYEADPLLYKNGPYGFYPFYDPRNFWERVQSGPHSESTSPSAF